MVGQPSPGHLMNLSIRVSTAQESQKEDDNRLEDISEKTPLPRSLCPLSPGYSRVESVWEFQFHVVPGWGTTQKMWQIFGGVVPSIRWAQNCPDHNESSWFSYNFRSPDPWLETHSNRDSTWQSAIWWPCKNQSSQMSFPAVKKGCQRESDRIKIFCEIFCWKTNFLGYQSCLFNMRTFNTASTSISIKKGGVLCCVSLLSTHTHKKIRSLFLPVETALCFIFASTLLVTGTCPQHLLRGLKIPLSIGLDL